MLIDYKHLLYNLLAVIHGDGGHYTEKNGPEQAAADAALKIGAERASVRLDCAFLDMTCAECDEDCIEAGC